MTTKFTKKELIEELEAIQEEKGRKPKKSDLISNSMLTADPFKREFGSWSNALDALENPEKYTSEEVLRWDYDIDKMSYVYLIESKCGRLKIGISEDPKERLSSIQGGSPREVRLVTAVLVRNPRKAEETLHDFFSEQNAHREWFELNYEDADRILDELKPFIY